MMLGRRGVAAIPKTGLKKHWAPSEDAFRELLEWLDGGVDSGGESYLEMRWRLSAYFDRRNCVSSDDLADETLNRVARRLHEEGAITQGPPGRYCYIMARFVFLEHVRRAKHDHADFDAIGDSGSLRSSLALTADTATEQNRRLLACLERCLEKLPRRDRELILEYYAGDQQARIRNRRELAARLNLTSNALSIRACRIRDTLEACVNLCDAEG